jgi:hypothetical protein
MNSALFKKEYRNLPEGGGGREGAQPACKVLNLTAIYELPRKYGIVDISQSYGLPWPVTFYFTFILILEFLRLKMGKKVSTHVRCHFSQPFVGLFIEVDFASISQILCCILPLPQQTMGSPTELVRCCTVRVDLEGS